MLEKRQQQLSFNISRTWVHVHNKYKIKLHMLLTITENLHHNSLKLHIDDACKCES